MYKFGHNYNNKQVILQQSFQQQQTIQSIHRIQGVAMSSSIESWGSQFSISNHESQEAIKYSKDNFKITEFQNLGIKNSPLSDEDLIPLALQKWIKLEYDLIYGNINKSSTSNLMNGMLASFGNQNNFNISKQMNKHQIQKIIFQLFTSNFLGKFLLKINYEYFSKTQLQNLFDYNNYYVDNNNNKNNIIYQGQKPLNNKGNGNFSKIIQMNKINNDISQRKIKYLKLIQKYMELYENKRFLYKYKQYLYYGNILKHPDSHEPQNHNNKKQSQYQKNLLISCQIIRLLLYLSIKSQLNKSQFIQRIFTFSSEDQQILMTQIMKIEQNLQNVTQTKQILEQTKKFQHQNGKLKNKYNQLMNKHHYLLQKYNKGSQDLRQIQMNFDQIKKQKQKIIQTLELNYFDSINKTYGNIYKKAIQKNQTLNRLLNIKQAKHNEVYEQYMTLKSKLEDYQQILDELNKQRKNFKVVLNDKKNQSFNLQMRASLRMSAEKDKLRKSSQAFNKRKSLCGKNINHLSMEDFLKVANIGNNGNNLLNLNLIHGNTHVAQSMNMHSKIQQLTIQHQQLNKELQNLKAVNVQIRNKFKNNKHSLNQLAEIYQKTMKLLTGLSFYQQKQEKQSQNKNNHIDVPFSTKKNINQLKRVKISKEQFINKTPTSIKVHPPHSIKRQKKTQGRNKNNIFNGNNRYIDINMQIRMDQYQFKLKELRV